MPGCRYHQSAKAAPRQGAAPAKTDMNTSVHGGSAPIIPCAMSKDKRFRNLIGKTFGLWRVVGLAGKRINTSGFFWHCHCSCGGTGIVAGSSLKGGDSTSCGCNRVRFASAQFTTHGRSHTPEHDTWMRMRQRCCNPKIKQWKDYGGRGIKVCERWQTFEYFLEDMGPKPSPRHSIDRINNDGNYEPSNCRWALPKQQARNTSRNRLISFARETMCLAAWEEKLGLPEHTLTSRLSQGWSEERAVATPRRYV